MESLLPLFNNLGLGMHHFKTFAAQLTLKNVQKKEHLIREGTVCDFIGFVTSGTLRSYIRNEEEELNNDFYFDNDIVSAYTSFLTTMPTNNNIEALTDSVVHFISREKLDRLIAMIMNFLNSLNTYRILTLSGSANAKLLF